MTTIHKSLYTPSQIEECNQLKHTTPSESFRKMRLRQCDQCQAFHFIATKEKEVGLDICETCTGANKAKANQNKEKAQLLAWGYTDIQEPTTNDHGKREYTLVTPCCQTTHTMVYGNINTMVKKNGKPPCPKCGGVARVAAAQASNLEHRSRTYDVNLYEDYAALIRTRSENTYRQYYDYLNPEKKLRGMGENDVHLDHKMSIRECFNHSIDPDLAASLVNLILIPRNENLSKSRKCTIDLRDWDGIDQNLIDPAELVKVGVTEDGKVEIIEIEPPKVVAEYVQQHVDNAEDNLKLRDERNELKTIAKNITELEAMGYTNIAFVGRATEGKSVLRYSMHYGNRVEELSMVQVRLLQKNGVMLWDDEKLTYKQFMRKFTNERLAARDVSELQREARRNNAKRLTQSVESRQKLSEARKGKFRWYHVDKPSFILSKDSPGEGWYRKEKIVAEKKPRITTEKQREARRKNGKIVRPQEAYDTMAEKKRGYKRWYHPDHPSFKQAAESPGEGWTTCKIVIQSGF